MPKLLTKTKRTWVDQRKHKQIKGLALNPNAAIEAHYCQSLRLLILRMTTGVHKQLEEMYASPAAEEYFGEDEKISGKARILTNKMADKFQQIFNIASKPLAETMTKQSSNASASSLESSLKKLSGGLTLKTNILSGDLQDIFAATVAENVALIRSIASEYLTDVQGAVMRSITTGNGFQDLVPFLQKHEGITLRRARVIARDQTRKTFSNMNFARLGKIGIQEYEWLHSAGGQKPRHLHQHMSGNIYRIDTPPIIQEAKGTQLEIRGKPGDLINCRCRAIPIIKFDE